MSAPAATPSPIVQIVGGTFEPESHLYRNAKGQEIPSVTQIMDSAGLVDLDNIPGATLEHKRKLGDAVHVATQFLDQGDLDWDTVHADCVPYVIAYENFKAETGFVVEAIEQGGIGNINGMEFGYTLDRVGRFPGIKYRAVIELKCAYKMEVAWKWQTAAYVSTVKRLQENEHIVRFATQLKPDGKFKMSPPYEDPRDIDVFTWALALTWSKINNGIRWKKEKL